MRIVEWDYNIKFFVILGVKLGIYGNDDDARSLYDIIDKFCEENNCKVTVFDTIVCNEEDFVVIKLKYPDAIQRIIHDSVTWAINARQPAPR